MPKSHDELREERMVDRRADAIALARPEAVDAVYKVLLELESARVSRRHFEALYRDEREAREKAEADCEHWAKDHAELHAVYMAERKIREKAEAERSEVLAQVAALVASRLAWVEAASLPGRESGPGTPLAAAFRACGLADRRCELLGIALEVQEGER